MEAVEALEPLVAAAERARAELAATEPSSMQRGGPATMPLNGVIKCWTDALQLMKVGGKSRLVCPADLAYGDQGWPPLSKSGATLVFEVELLGISQPSAQTAPQSEQASSWYYCNDANVPRAGWRSSRRRHHLRNRAEFADEPNAEGGKG